MTDELKPLTKAELRKLEKDGEKVGKLAPTYTAVECGAQIKYHEIKRTGYGAILQPSEHSKYFHLNMFSFKVTGTTCEITSCEYDYVHVSEITDYLQADKKGVKADSTNEITEAIEWHLATKNIGISKFI